MTQANQEWRPRLSIELTQEQADALTRWLPYGFRRRVFSVITDLLITALERDGMAVVTTILERELDIPSILSRKGK